MPTAPLISVADLAARIDAGRHVQLFDCSFELANPGAGRKTYEAGHIPGARYLHLDDDLSGPKTGRNGRHPLPGRTQFAARMAAHGAHADALIVGYDGTGGSYASRLWWMLRWIGHAECALLDGGLAAWRAAGLPVAQGPEAPPAAPGSMPLRAPLVGLVDFDAVLANLGTRQRVAIDARSPERFRGQNETLDPVGGRIPGSRNRFFRDNLGADGRFKPASALRAEFDAVLQGTRPDATIALCGSGVTACHNLLAMELAGLPGGLLYPGSWSEWCAQPDAPRAAGAG